MKEATSRTVELLEYPSRVVKAVVDYMYGADLELDDADLPAALQLSHYLQIDQLITDLIPASKETLRSENALAWYALAQQLDIPELTKASATFLKENFNSIIKEEAFIQLEVTGLMGYVRILKRVPVHQIVAAVVNWVHHDAEQRSSHLREVLRKVPAKKWSDSGLAHFLEQYYDRDRGDTTSIVSIALSANSVMLDIIKKRQLTTRANFVSNLSLGKALAVAKVSDTSGVQIQILGEDGIFCEPLKCPSSISSGVAVQVCATPAGFVILNGKTGACQEYRVQQKLWKSLPNMGNQIKFLPVYHHGKLCVVGRRGEWLPSNNFDALYDDDNKIVKLELITGAWQSDELSGSLAGEFDPIALLSTEILIGDNILNCLIIYVFIALLK
jgi:hypothetical protein